MGISVKRVRVWAAVAVLPVAGVGALAATASTPSRRAVLDQLQTAAAPARPASGPGVRIVHPTRSGYAVVLSLAPNLASGPNRMSVRVTKHGRPLTGARVKLSFSMPSMNMWQAYTTVLTPAGLGRYEATVPVLGMAGRWQLRISVSPRACTAFPVTVTDRMGA
jgi:YtkA-like